MGKPGFEPMSVAQNTIGKTAPTAFFVTTSKFREKRSSVAYFVTGADGCIRVYLPILPTLAACYSQRDVHRRG